MIELFSLFKLLNYSESFDIQYDTLPSKIPVSWIIMVLIISFGSAYIAFCCNEYEQPSTRALSTIVAFFFSGFYLIYYFIFHVLFDRKCGSRRINNVIKNISK